MSFLTAVPAELAAAAAQLGAIGSALAAQNAGAAAPTTAIAPAAADQVSIIQSGIFTAYGALYQQIAAEAQAIQEQFVQTLGLSSGTYESTEASNASAAAVQSAASSGGLPDFINQISTVLGGPLPSLNGQPFSLSGNMANIANFQTGNWTSAASDLMGLAGGGLLPTDSGADAAGAVAEGAEGAAAAEIGAVGGVAGTAPVAAGVGEATLVGGLAVPPSWATPATLVSATTPSALSGAGWTAAAPTAAPGAFYPGMPGMASAARNSAGFGAPRYGVKPIVMPKPVSV
ncbi:PE domain-containing protein [Mycobacterium kubicae]|uniref:PPE family protein, SVP subgroup n=1 Tax=Mycobacterium kubicae TaxID=120959 RepID=UPI0016418107|nr:PE domain-containing protein [Mycobacterium kubicae]QNI08312.1 PE domain-containing protein [Mycobacterium kubicae]